MGKFGGGWRGEFSLFSTKKALSYVGDPRVLGLEILLINVLSRLRCECQLHSEGTARTALHWCVRTIPPCSVNGEGHAFMEPWLPRSCRQDQAEVPAWTPRGTCVLQIGNPRETPPIPGQPFPSAASAPHPRPPVGRTNWTQQLPDAAVAPCL